MPSYYYRARDTFGRAHEGVEVAASEDEVLRALSQMQLTPVSIETRGQNGAAQAGARPTSRVPIEAVSFGSLGRMFRRPVQPGSVALFARQLATMMSAGLPLVRALRSIARDHTDRRLSRILGAVGDDVQKGDSLATALGRHPDAFSDVLVSLIHTGEISGSLDEVLLQTAGYLERAELLRLKVEAALRYPTFILSFAGVVLSAMFFKIVPMFSDIYARFGVDLPVPTRVLLAISHALTANALLVVAVILLVVTAFWAWLRTDEGRTRFDGYKFRVPLFGGLVRMYAMTRYARTLGILVGSGTNILYALRVLRPVPGNRLIGRAIERVSQQVEGGASLSRSMSDTGVFPDMLVQMTATGEETGRLDEMLSRTADFYEQRVTAKVEGLSSLVEPVAIVLLGLVIALMLVALYLPIFNLGHAMRSGILSPS
jgi:type II secretory pathway component PulF